MRQESKHGTKENHFLFIYLLNFILFHFVFLFRRKMENCIAPIKKRTSSSFDPDLTFSSQLQWECFGMNHVSIVRRQWFISKPCRRAALHHTAIENCILMHSLATAERTQDIIKGYTWMCMCVRVYVCAALEHLLIFLSISCISHPFHPFQSMRLF